MLLEWLFKLIISSFSWFFSQLSLLISSRRDRNSSESLEFSDLESHNSFCSLSCTVDNVVVASRFVLSWLSLSLFKSERSDWFSAALVFVVDCNFVISCVFSSRDDVNSCTFFSSFLVDLDSAFESDGCFLVLGGVGDSTTSCLEISFWLGTNLDCDFFVTVAVGWDFPALVDDDEIWYWLFTLLMLVTFPWCKNLQHTWS